MRNQYGSIDGESGESVTGSARGDARGLIVASTVKCKFSMRDAGSASCGAMPFRGRSPSADTGTGTEY